METPHNMTLVNHKPHFSPAEAQELAAEIFGVTGTVTALPGERDQNVRIITADGDAYVLKIANSQEDKDLLQCQNRIMDHLNAKNSREGAGISRCPHVIPSLDGDTIITVTNELGRSFFTRMLSWVPGKPLAKIRPHDDRLLENLGVFFAHLDLDLADFDYPAAHRQFYWDLNQAREVVHAKITHIKNDARRNLIALFLTGYEDRVLAKKDSLRTGIIHNDGNDYNIMLSSKNRWGWQVEGVIDFGDIIHTQLINELAILCAYAMMDKADPLRIAGKIIAGYHSVYPLIEEEVFVLYDLICMRLCVGVCNAAEQASQAPDNPYLSISEKPAWHLLSQLRQIHHRLARYIFRDVCRMKPVPTSKYISQWISDNSAKFSPLTGNRLTKENTIVFDLSVISPMITAGAELHHSVLLTDRLFSEMAHKGAKVGIGRYNEIRIGYVSDQFAEPGDERPRRRTVHLGLDLFMVEGTPISAVYDGVIHSLANNDKPLDYGPTIILSHQTTDGERFFTLYGHLSLDSLNGITPGDKISAGQIFARVGSSDCNGGSPPHVHFQVIMDMMNFNGDFPGVARSDYQRLWNSISPSPAGLLGLEDIEVSCATRKDIKTISYRRDHLGKNLSISYDKPLTIVRGVAQYLYSDTGQAYLDCVNNVAHVGHCHPHVVAAGQKQMGVLNTNTRYLHDHITNYAKRLLAKFPEPLSVCYFVCTGSEANELALRMARAYTKARDIIILDGAYHGNTQGLIDISPYKHDGPGGSGAPSWTHKVMMPCGYRGPYKGKDPQIGKRYAEEVGKVVDHIKGQGKRPAVFICESMLGCGGQVILPENYLTTAFDRVRAAGGVCIIDEVQVGFGRAGSHFWAFETQDAIPDIVTLGKPMGNGHPIAAVVTTPEIAAAFNNGMEYFNTFGGNPVSCAIGMAVLDVIEKENLQENAHVIGKYLIEKLRPLKETFPLVGDVRGLGLYAGVELVVDRHTLEPAPDHASYIINRMRDHGILLSTDGPLHNVIKFKPPMVFSRENVDRVVKVLEKILQEDCLQP